MKQKTHRSSLQKTFQPLKLHHKAAFLWMMMVVVDAGLWTCSAAIVDSNSRKLVLDSAVDAEHPMADSSSFYEAPIRRPA
mmetsp:Transcript_3752/g.23617  ORF Transcript_3752/g.23617 Transcript_3752/m.23617 type:complete len:80 (+) Transcript_3752:1046-1285(+)